MSNMYSLIGKTAVVTGATSGIGLATAEMLAAQGATVIGVGRNGEKAERAEQQIRTANPSARISYLLADFTRLTSVRQLASSIQTTLTETGAGHLDILVNNAGTYNDACRLTEDGLETTQAVNHFAPFLLTHLLLDVLCGPHIGRVISVSSESHERTWLNPERFHRPLVYNGLWAYKVSKLANVLFIAELNRRYSSRGLRGFAIDPGLVSTDIGFKGTGWLARRVWQMRKDAGISAQIPADTITYLAAAPLAELGEAIYWKERKPVRPSDQARRSDLAERLWKSSEKLTGSQE
jgi:retinol dehydrogenase 12